MVLVAIKLVSKVRGEISVPPWLLSTALIVLHNLYLKVKKEIMMALVPMEFMLFERESWKYFDRNLIWERRYQ